METTLKLTIFWVIIFTAFAAGGLFKKYFPEKEGAAGKLITFNLVLLEPPVLLWTIWGLSITAEAAILPLAGLITVISGFAIGTVITRIISIKGKSRDSFRISSSLSNHGITMGGMICYLIAGEAGLGLASIYIIYFLPFVFLFIFPFAGYSSLKNSSIDKKSGFDITSFFRLFLSFRNLPLAGIIAALLLQTSGMERPEIFFPLDLLLFAIVAIYYFTLGISFNFRDLTAYKKEQVYLSLVRFFIVPAVTLGVIYPLEISAGIKSVIFIQSFMPAAVYSVISVILYDLDSRLNSSLFAMNTLIFLSVILPLMIFFKDFFIF